MNKELNAKFLNVSVYQDLERENGIKKNRVFSSFASESIDNCIYMFAMKCNCICKIELESGNMDVMCGDDEYPRCTDYLYLRSVVCDNNIYFISKRKKKILKFNINTNKKDYILFKGNSIDYEPYLHENLLFLLPMGYDENYICINLSNDTVSYFPTSLKKQLDLSILTDNYIFGNGVSVGEFIYQGGMSNSIIQRLNTKTHQFDYFNIEGFDRSIRKMEFDGVYFWVLSKDDGLLIQWDYKTRKTIYSVDLTCETNNCKMLYSSCKCANDCIYITEKSGSRILELNIKSKHLNVYDCCDIPGFRITIPGKQTFAENVRVDQKGRICFFPVYANGIVILEQQRGVLFYKIENSMLLEIQNFEQVQTESVCLIENFIEKIKTINEDVVGCENVGSRIMKWLTDR